MYALIEGKHHMKISTKLRLSAGSLAVGFALATTPAYAQDNDETVDVTTENAAEDEGAITVTGSRIRLPNLESTEPTVTITDEFIDQRNFINVADALNDLPIIRGSVTPNGGESAFGQGVNFINIFGLGTNRSLTLLNGRRVVSSNTPTLFGPGAPGLQVDLNVIPAALVKQVDIASTAGAPVYGSDAIAGTVNLILDDEYEGLELTATSSIYQQGDGFQYRFEGVYGTQFADGRGHLQLSSFYTQTDGILQNQRQNFRDNIENEPNTLDFLRLDPDLPLDTGPNDGVPSQVAFRGVNLIVLSNNGVIFGGPIGVGFGSQPGDTVFQFDAGGDLIPFTVGARTSGIRAVGGGDGFQFVDFNQLTSDLRRFGANVFANYDVTDNINVFTELQYYDARADELVQQPTFNTPLFGGGSSALTFSIDNPFLNDQARGVLAANGVDTFTLSRANVGFADLTGFAETELLRGVLGARGDFELMGRDWNWEGSFVYGSTDVTDNRQDINQQLFANATNVALDANGVIQCAANLGPVDNPVQPGSPVTPIADTNCVPFNFFGLQASPEALAYVIEENQTLSELEQVVINVNVGGSPFAVFGNDVGVNIGYEHRSETGRFNPSEFEQLGRGRGAAITPIEGSFNVDEVFGELFVPLVTPENDFIVESITAYARGRYVDNTVNGGFFSWAAGGSIAPVPDIEFRGNFTRSFRAPAVTELFLPTANAFAAVADLCSVVTPPANGGNNPEARAANCAAFNAFFPNRNDPQLAAQRTVPILAGGNPDLDNEQADSYSLGVILRPWFAPGLSLTTDYVNISISDPIANLTTAQINIACFDNDEFNAADPANGNAFCSLIQRDAIGEVIADASNPGVRTGFTNGNGIDFEGIQSELNYSTSLESVGIPGDLALRGSLQVVLQRVIDITGVAPGRSDAVIGDPTWSGQLAAQYRLNNFGFGTVLNYTGEQLFSRTDRTPDARQFDQLRDFVTADFNIFFETDDDFRFNFVVSNAFGRECQRLNDFCIPGVSPAGNPAGNAINDAFGRQFSASVTKSF